MPWGGVSHGPQCRRPRRGIGRCLLAGLLVLPEACAFEWTWGSPNAQKHATDELDDSNFDPFLQEHPVTAILFYAPWCFYSQQVMPAWDTAAQKLMLHDPPVYLAKIDAHRYGTVGDKYGVNAFPTMKLFLDGAIFDYDSHAGRGWQQIVNWVNKHIDRDHVLKQVEDVDNYLHDNDLNVVGLFPDGYNSSIFGLSSRHFEDVIFAEARGTEVATQVADHLSKHATLVCETIDVGQSPANTKQVALPREHMHCSDHPRNPQRPEWKDSFVARVEGMTLTVQRTDEAAGWQQLLQMKCCDDENITSRPRLQIPPPPAIVMFMPHDERFAVYDGDVHDIHTLDRWITARRTPMVMRLTQETADKILDSGPEKTPVLFLISKEPALDHEKILREAAKLLRGRVLVCISGLGSQIERRLGDLAGLDDDASPVVTLIETHSGTGPFHTARKYRLPSQGLTPAAVVQFVTDYEQGRLKPWLKSEPEPSAEDQAAEAVSTLVGTTFRQTVDDENMDVLVDFYAPWCGHCRKFEPAYKSLARKLKHVKTLRVAKLDATRNEVEGMQIMGFPTIVLFPAGKPPKRQVTYGGNRSPEDMTRWLQEHCTHKFEGKPPPKEAAQGTQLDPVASGLLDPSEEDL